MQDLPNGGGGAHPEPQRRQPGGGGANSGGGADTSIDPRALETLATPLCYI